MCYSIVLNFYDRDEEIETNSFLDSTENFWEEEPIIEYCDDFIDGIYAELIKPQGAFSDGFDFEDYLYCNTRNYLAKMKDKLTATSLERAEDGEIVQSITFPVDEWLDEFVSDNGNDFNSYRIVGNFVLGCLDQFLSFGRWHYTFQVNGKIIDDFLIKPEYKFDGDNVSWTINGEAAYPCVWYG